MRMQQDEKALHERLCGVGAEGERRHRCNQHTHGFSWMWDTNGAGMDLLHPAADLLQLDCSEWHN